MIDYIAIATDCAAEITPDYRRWSLLAVCPSEMADAAAADLQNAIDNAFRVGQLGVVGEQVEMFRRAA